MKEQDEPVRKENALGHEIAGIINDDDKLKKFFTKVVSKTLIDFALREVKAQKENNTIEGQRIMQEAVDTIKQLTMHVCVKIITKREAK